MDSIPASGVDDFEYQVPFRFNGEINKLTYKLGPEQLSADDKATAAKDARGSQGLGANRRRKPCETDLG